jgi:hypothetical protein
VSAALSGLAAIACSGSCEPADSDRGSSVYHSVNLGEVLLRFPFLRGVTRPCFGMPPLPQRSFTVSLPCPHLDHLIPSRAGRQDKPASLAGWWHICVHPAHFPVVNRGCSTRGTFDSSSRKKACQHSEADWNSYMYGARVYEQSGSQEVGAAATPAFGARDRRFCLEYRVRRSQVRRRGLPA